MTDTSSAVLTVTISHVPPRVPSSCGRCHGVPHGFKGECGAGKTTVTLGSHTADGFETNEREREKKTTQLLY